jgi:flavin-dependent dehydrogenase
MTSASPASHPDVVVIGGGPAGSAVSTLIAQQGYRVELFERDHFPRFHIGESLIPETYWVLEPAEHAEKMRASHFVKKYSVQFVNRAGEGVGAVLLLDHNKPHEASQTWQVRRSEFDA